MDEDNVSTDDGIQLIKSNTTKKLMQMISIITKRIWMNMQKQMFHM